MLDEGEPVAALLHRLHAQGGRRKCPLFDDYLQRLLDAAGPATLTAEAVPVSSSSSADDLQEPLTRKEIRVLQLLAWGYSNSTTAEKLFVSDCTVRTHLRKNMKLDAKSQTQAVAIARRLGVIR